MTTRLPWFSVLCGLVLAALAGWPQPPRAASVANASAGAEAMHTYLVYFRDPPATRFAASEQVAEAKALGLNPTAAKGKRRFDADSADAKRYIAYLDRQQDRILADAAALFGRALPPRFRYRYLGNGVALRLSPEEAAQLRELPGVAAVRRNFKRRPLTDAGPAFIEAPLLWNGTLPGSALQTKGEGVVIGVIDTGINASHPAFADIGGDGFNHSNPRGQRFGLCNQPGETRCNDKLIGIYDFVDEPDSQKGADIDGHGSHVASTAAGNFYVASGQSGLLPLNLSGVAPHANLIMYKACGSDGIDCPFDALFAALDRATRDGVDVINYSIGGEPRDPWTDLAGSSPDDAGLFLNARAAGIVGVVAAGNEGPGPGTVTSPGNAPWVITAANSSSDRRFQESLRGVSGTGLSTPRDFVGAGLTTALGNRPIVHARDFGDADCNRGSDIDFPPTGASNPFAAGTFSGQIVICERGINARVAKGFNLKAAGAGGMVLVNTAAEGESIVADDHFLPAVHLGFASGSELAAVVEAARQAGGALSGDISGAERILGSGGDVLNRSSSRGPNPGFDGVLKPDLAAPGTDILAASNLNNGYASLTGTSMATPHIAGAAALLLAAHPGWSVAQVESALLGSASASIVLDDGVTPAHGVEGGVGRTRIGSAVRAPLHLAIATGQYIAANPASGGDPRQLNRPALHNAHCRDTCSFTRTVTDNGTGGNYSVLTEASDGALVTVTPTNFTLAPGGQQTLNITVDVRNDQSTGHWIDGGVRLRNTSAAPDTLADFVLPLSVFADPGPIPASIELSTNAGNASAIANLSGLVAIGDASFAAAGTTIIVPAAINLTADPDDPDDAFNNTGAFQRLFLLDAPDGGEQGRIYAEASSGFALGGKVFIGRDDNGDGLADAGEVRCQSPATSGTWRCAVDSDWSIPGTRYWVLAHNARSNNQTLSTTVRIVNVARDADGEHGIVVSGPRRLAANSTIPLRIGWNLPQLRGGETAASFVRIGANHEQPDQLGWVPLFIRRNSNSTPAPIVLDAGGDTVELNLAAAQAHERMVIDVPANAVSLTVSSTGSSGDIDLYLARATAPPTPPLFAPAPPRGDAQGTSIHPGSNETITLTAPTLSPGRWYVTPVNAGGTPVTFTLSVSLQTSGAIVQPAANAWFNPDRDGHGIFLAKTDSAWVLAWYTFETDGKPTWYLASAPAPAAEAGSWSAPLARFTWNGVETGTGSFGNAVGKVMLSFDRSDGFSYSWLLFGEYGSEPFRAIGPTACAQDGAVLRSISGGWFDPNNPGWGLFAQSFINGIDANALYLFDQRGEPRWLFGSGSFPGAAELPVFQINGFCPTCTFAPTTATQVGTLTRSYDSNQTGRHNIQATFVNGVPGAWQLDKPVSKITADQACAGQ
ncbi:MAG: S8 family serine peptidase [Lysobacterales bacterium]